MYSLMIDFSFCWGMIGCLLVVVGDYFKLVASICKKRIEDGRLIVSCVGGTFHLLWSGCCGSETLKV